MGIHMAKPPVLVMVDGVVCGDRHSIVMERIQNRMDNIHTDVMIKCRFMINMMILRLSDGFDDLLLVGLVSKSKCRHWHPTTNTTTLEGTVVSRRKAVVDAAGVNCK
jgi:hypothetical protein